VHKLFFVNQFETLITFLFSRVCKNLKFGCPKRACHISGDASLIVERASKVSPLEHKGYLVYVLWLRSFVFDP
jgi:hypothetical protein